MVAKGYTQKEGIDYDEVFAPVVSITGIRLLLSIAVKNGLHLRKYDVSNAYLHSDLDKELYIEIPQGFTKQYSKGQVLLNQDNFGISC